MPLIDINFNFYSDTPQGKDPDSHSPTLRKYHRILWSKTLPGGTLFDLNLNTPKLLHHISDLGEFFLSSDSVGHTYRNVKRMSPIIDQVDPKELNSFFSICSTIGAYVIFPSKKINNKLTINSARGLNHKIQDRFDLTLECIRRFYLKQTSPLSETLDRYFSFFDLFHDFKGYVDFFLLQDLVHQNYLTINFWKPFDSFAASPLPKDVTEYYVYKKNLIEFIDKRNQRLSA